MSLYVFDVYEDHATVSADSRMCTTDRGKIYRIHDHQQKLYVVDDIIVTVGGVAWVCTYIMERFKANRVHTVKALHQIVLDTVSRLDELARFLGAPLAQHHNNDYAFEACIVQFDPVERHNVFYNIATYNKYQLASVDVWSGGQSHIVGYGGIDFHIVRDYMETHKAESETDYTLTLLKGYEAAASEKVGGILSVAIQNRQNIRLEKYPIRDNRKLMEYSDLTGTTLLGHNIIGERLAMTCPDEEGKPIHFRFDSLGLYSYNARQYWRGESGGFVLLDPDYGFMLGTEGNPLVVDGDGRVHPSCIGKNNELIFEDIGKHSNKKIPKGMNLYMGVDGNLYMRGDFYANDIYVENGTFNGVVRAQDFQLPSGDSVVSVLNSQGQIKGDYIDAKGINIKDPATGETVLYMDATGIHWAAKYSPIKYQYASSTSGPWHDTRSANDEYRRESTDGGTTWSDGIKFVARDGRNGNDANVTFDNMLKALQKAESIKTSFITADAMGAPTIYGAKIYGAEIYAGGIDEKGGQILALTDRGVQVLNGMGDNVLTIHETDGGAEIASGFNYLTLNSPYINIGRNKSDITFFRGSQVDFTNVQEVDFTDVKTKGLHVTLA